MASSNPVPCGPCKQEKVNTKADIWCYNCDEGLCSTCSGHHKKFRLTRDHKTIDVQTYKPPIGSIKTDCDAHSQPFNLYCPNHLMPCCDECISTHHSKCTGIKSLTIVVEKAKIEKSKESVDKDINSILLFMNKMANKKSSNIKKGEQQCESIKESIGKIREKINKHLDHLEKKLCKEADTEWDQEKIKLTSFITEIEEKKKKLEELQDDLHTVTEHTSKLQSFLGVNQIGEKVHQYQRYLDDIENNEGAIEVDIKIKQNDAIEKILGELQLCKSFGEVKVVKTVIETKRQTDINREAQVKLQEQSNINNLKINIEKKIKIHIGNIRDMICLMDGRVLIAVEMKDIIYLITSDGKLQKKLKICGEAWSVSQLNQNTIAITFPDEKVIKIYNMKNEEVIKVITFDKRCFGLSFSNDFLAVGVNGEFRILDLKGTTLKSIRVQSKSSLNYFVYSNDRVVYSDYNDKAVNCVDESGKQIWQYKHGLEGPQGLCTDTYGNIFVVDFKSERIIVISKDGQNSKVLISKEDGLDFARCIGFKKDNCCGVICDSMGRYMTKFNL